MLGTGFSAVEVHNSYYNALEYKISPAISQYEPLTFGIKTSEPTRCKLSLRPPNLPESSWWSSSMLSSLPIIWFSDGAFKTSHNITLRFPNPIINNLTNYELFVRCVDTVANANTEEFFISLAINKTLKDIPLIILGTEPKLDKLKLDNSKIDLSLYVNKPFQDCSYSNLDLAFENMNSFNCSTTDYDIVYENNKPFGSFICASKLTLNSSVFYFKCKDMDGNINTEVTHFLLLGNG